MKANELRIGNLILSPDTSKPVKVELNHIKAIIDGIQFNDKYYDPIPITPEMLEKAGFVKSTGGYGDGIPTLGKFEASLYDEDNFIKQLCSIRYDGKIIIKVASLHQLQNLYFALTGTELEINL